MPDVGERLVERLYSMSQVDDKWSMRTNRGFSWWAGDLAQHVWADQPVQVDGSTRSRVHVRTDVITGFNGTERQLQVLGALARFATLSGWLRHPQDASRLQLAAAISVGEESLDFLSSLLSFAGAVQAAEAHIMIPLFENSADWAVARTNHPSTGHRSYPDDMLEMIEHMPMKSAASRWAGSDMLAVLELLQRPPCILATGDATGVAAEFSFPALSGSSLLQISTRETHPRLGAGCLFRLTLPITDHRPNAIVQALELNEREATEHNHLLGSWCPSEHGLTYVSFLPNVAFNPGALTHMARSLMYRVQWVTEEVFDHDLMEHYAPAIEMIGARMRALTGSDPAPMADDHPEGQPSHTTDTSRESFHERVADRAVRDGERSSDFRAAAQAKATAFTIWLGIAVVVWLAIGFGWALFPMALAGFAGIQSVSATQVARAMESRNNGMGSPADSAEAQHFDLEDPADVQLIDQIREAYSELLMNDDSEYASCVYKPVSLLPYPKQTIAAALTALLDVAEGRRRSPLLASTVRDSNASETLRTVIDFLDDFVEIPAARLPTDPIANIRVGSSLKQTA
jgi:hypothetical protein